MSSSRRQFLRSLIGGGVVASSAALPMGLAHAIGPAGKLRIGRLRYRGDWDPHPGAGRELAAEVQLRTSVDVAVEEIPLTPDHPRMAWTPIAVLAGRGDFSWSPTERAALRRWLEVGGFLFVDNSGESEDSPAFDRAVRREFAAMFPRSPFERVSPEHVVYRSFYRLDYPAGRALRRPSVEGLQIGRRYGVILSHNDMLGAYVRDASGRFQHRPTPGGENQREMAFRFGVNLVMYGLCLHYKDDQVHLDYLLHKRKWKIEKPE